jgi:precorrin-2/cobalt-factor-2 C20-methyltransferase
MTPRPVLKGTLYGVGVGPGDPELLTLRAHKVLNEADVIAYFAKEGRRGTSRTIVDGLIGEGRNELPMYYPFTTERHVTDPVYVKETYDFYEASCATIDTHLRAGKCVAVLAEGDPFFFGSFMHLWRRLVPPHTCEIVPGITGMAGCWSRANAPMTFGDDIMTVLPATLPPEKLASRLADTDAAVVMKIGRHLGKVRKALAAAGRLDQAIYVERGTMSGERIMPLADKADDDAPYFSIVLLPGNGRRI